MLTHSLLLPCDAHLFLPCPRTHIHTLRSPQILGKRSCKLDKEYVERLDFELYAAIRASLEQAYDA